MENINSILYQMIQKNNSFYKNVITPIIDDNKALYIVDNNRKIIYWSKKCEEITGYSKEEIVNKRCYDSLLSHKTLDDQPLCNSFCPLISTMFDSKVRHHIVTFLHKNKKRYKIDVTTYPIYDGYSIIGCYEVFYLID